MMVAGELGIRRDSRLKLEALVSIYIVDTLEIRFIGVREKS